MNDDKQAIFVTTEHKGVFFGYADSLDAARAERKETDGDAVTITEARCCVYWPEECHGFLGLAKQGPLPGAKVSPAADELTVYSVTSLSPVTDEAAERWEEEPWT